MSVHVERKQDASLYETPLLQQSFFWSQVKRRQGIATQSFDLRFPLSEISGEPSSASVTDDILFLIFPLPGGRSIAYAPYGPLLHPREESYGAFLEELSEALRPFFGKKTVLVRYDLPWKRPWDEELTDPALMELRMNWGTEKKNVRKSPMDQLPSDTMIVDLRGSEEEILERMRPKTRYNIRLARRKGVEVWEGGAGDIDLFCDLYGETARRNGITLHDSSFFHAFAGVRDEEAGCSLLFAGVGGKPLSAMFLSHSGNRASYLFGASRSEGRETMSTYALQWEAMKRAKRMGCLSYDMFGTAPDGAENHPMHGLWRFKRGFGGRMLHRLGCWEYDYDPEAAREIHAMEMVDKGYHQNSPLLA